jgi:hypothetical protein
MSKKTKYWIYHVPGVKIGVSNNPEHRVIKQQGFTEYEILEEHINIKIVSERERELQLQYGYKVDNILYWKTIRFQKKGSSPEARKKATAKMDWVARSKNTDWAAKVAKTDYKAIAEKIDWGARTAKINYEALGEQKQKIINQYDLQGNLLNTYKGLQAVKEALNKPYDCTRAISRCCRGEQKHAFKFKWKYA